MTTLNSINTNTGASIALESLNDTPYGANAKIFTAVQSMWTQLLASVT